MPLNKGVDKSMVCILEKGRKKVSSPGIDIHHVVTNSQRLYLLDNTDISSNIFRGRRRYGTEVPASSHAAVTTIGFPSFRVFFQSVDWLLRHNIPTSPKIAAIQPGCPELGTRIRSTTRCCARTAFVNWVIR